MLGRTRERWSLLTLYQRFEDCVAIALAMTMAVIVAAALVHLIVDVIQLLRTDAFDPENQAVFHKVFGMVMTLLIALELKHTILGIAERKNHAVQVQTVILVALIAVARKFIILDVSTSSPQKIAALALVTLALGAGLWFLRGYYLSELPSSREAQSA